MSNRKISLDYVNSVVYDLQKAFWDERGKGARFRVTTVGRDYFLNKCLPRMESQDEESIIQVVEHIMQDEGIVTDISHSIDNQLLNLKVQGCMHQPVEQRLVAKGVEPFTCIPANLVVLAIEETLDRPVELAEVKIEDDECHIQIILFKSRPTFE